MTSRLAEIIFMKPTVSQVNYLLISIHVVITSHRPFSLHSTLLWCINIIEILLLKDHLRWLVYGKALLAIMQHELSGRRR